MPGTPLLGHFEEMLQCFESARHRCGGGQEAAFELAGRTVRIRFAGNELAPLLTPALSHLPTPAPGGSRGLQIVAWDSASTGEPAPEPPWVPATVSGTDIGTADAAVESGVWHVAGERIHAAVDPSAGHLSMLDLETGRAVFWTRDSGRLPLFEASTPFRDLLHWWLRKHGLQFAHASTVASERGGVLFAGSGGSGKSTTALACLSEGLQYGGDDYVLLEEAAGRWQVHAAYSSGKLDGRGLQLLPAFEPLISNPDRTEGDKGLVFLQTHVPERITLSFPLRAILLPKLGTRGGTRLVPASAAEVLRAWAPSSVLQLKGFRTEGFGTLSRLVRAIPGYVLHVGPDPSRVAPLVRELLAAGRSHAVSSS